MFIAVIGIRLDQLFALLLQKVAAHVASRCTLHIFAMLLWREDRLERLSPFVPRWMPPRKPWTLRACNAFSCSFWLSEGEVACEITTLLASDVVRKTLIYEVHGELHPVTAAVASGRKSCGRWKITAMTTKQEGNNQQHAKEKRRAQRPQQSGAHPAQHTSAAATIPPACKKQYISGTFVRCGWITTLWSASGMLVDGTYKEITTPSRKNREIKSRLPEEHSSGKNM